MKKTLPSKKERHILFGSVEPREKVKPTKKSEMVDLQNTKKDFLFPIDQVGVSNVKIPATLLSKLEPKIQSTIATFTLSCSISSEYKGTNMSRFTEQLEVYRQNGLNLDFSNLRDFVVELSNKLEQQKTTIEVQFPWFYERTSTAMKFTGMNHSSANIKIVYDRKVGFTHEVSLECVVTTLCPCSKEISEYSAHNQRGYVTITAILSENFDESIDWKVELLNAAESNASSMMFPVLKRPDEKMVTEMAYENPRFVEDMVRLVAADLYEVGWISEFTVTCRNEESIHIHDAIATISMKK
ncbi:GTP cyclohydrolase FolE2 [Gottfriedia acidiceleris]|uniref:GTP cyclohydrolase FolE2 n=1 Tax=Gottfriedia acidiceleris TaxID=371036 RepID=UPI000B44B9C0|nr:GTP cyclohydrolase FolE2 [Gottfriedia acidiceleris]